MVFSYLSTAFARVAQHMLWLVVCLSVWHTTVLYQNGWMAGAGFWLPLVHPTLLYNGIQLSLKVGVLLSSGTLSHSVNLANFCAVCHGTSTITLSS